MVELGKRATPSEKLHSELLSPLRHAQPDSSRLQCDMQLETYICLGCEMVVGYQIGTPLVMDVR